MSVVITGRLRSALEALSDSRFLDVRGRIGRRLLDLAQPFGKRAGPEVELDIPLHQKDLADMVGATRESVNRILAAMAAEGLVGKRGSTLIVRRPDRLAAES